MKSVLNKRSVIDSDNTNKKKDEEDKEEKKDGTEKAKKIIRWNYKVRGKKILIAFESVNFFSL